MFFIARILFIVIFIIVFCFSNDFPPPPPPEGQQKSSAHKTIGNILSGAVNAAKSPPKAANEPDFAKVFSLKIIL